MFLEVKCKSLISAISKDDFEEVKKILDDLRNERSEQDVSQVVNFPLGAFGMRAMHLAAFKNKLDIVKLLLENGGHADAADRLGRTPLHLASDIGSSELLNLLIQNGAYVNARYGVTTWSKLQTHETLDAIPLPTIFGRTPLHAATSNLHYDCVKILLENKADANVEDDEGQTPLLTTGENLRSDCNMFKSQFEAIVDLLLQHGAQIHFLNSATCKGIMHRALEFNSLKTCREILKLGYDVGSVNNNGDTILHESCKIGNAEFTEEIINNCKTVVNHQNKKNVTPMHYAAYSGSKCCLNLLLNNGGDLSKTTSYGQSVVDAILASIPRPTNFLLKILDSKIIPNRSSVNEKYFNITLDYQMLTPDDDRQMSVITSLIKSLKSDQKPKIILHPLIESFIRLKWSRLRLFFFFLVIIHLFFVVSLSMYVVFLFDSGSKVFLYWSRLVLLSTATVLLLHIITEISLAPKYYLKEYETWLTITCVSLALAMGIWEAYEMKDELPVWIRHMAAYDALLSWTLMMFILGRFPFVGYFALMFSTVLRNVLKVLLFFACLVIGFSLSFCIQFNDIHFADPWKSFVRTTVMLMGEFEYTDIFKENDEKGDEKDNKVSTRFNSVSNSLDVTSRVIFLLFVLLGSIVLMNLMTGLAVNDIQGIRAEGCVRHIIKQAEFISHVEKILSQDKLRFLPKKIKRFIFERKTLPDIIILEPNSSRKNYGNKCKNQIKNNISFKLMESIMLIAIENQKKNKLDINFLNDDRDEKDYHEWIDLRIDTTMNEIKNELLSLSSKLDELIKNRESNA